MTSFWKWLAVAGCGVGLLVAADRLRDARADEEGGSYRRAADGDAMQRLDRIVEKLDAIVDRMGQGGPGGRPHAGRPPYDHGRPPRDEDSAREHHGPYHDGHGRPPHDRPHPGRFFAEMPPEVREAMEKRMKEGRERMEEVRKRMEQAREKFQEMEERIRKLEAEVAALKVDNK